MPPPRNGSTPSSSCISRILRRILCFNALPLRSLDHEQAVTDEPGCTPSLMARLMGLDTVPSVCPPAEDSPTTSGADSCRRRRKSRRIIPPYRELEDENFFILSFERRKPGRGSRRRKGKENEGGNVVLEGDFRAERQGNVLIPLRNSGREPGKMEDEVENSSPNSVLEFVGFGNDQESDSPGEVSRLANSKTRRPLPLPLALPDELDSSENSRERKSINNADDEICGSSEERESINNADDEKEKIDSRVRIGDAEKWDEIGVLAATETIKSSWLREEMAINRHCFMEISRDMESSILDHLLEELLIDLEVF